MSSQVEKIKEKLEITEVVGSYIKLEKAGASFKAKCPFHNEKTPSFFVSPSRGSYYCFGCGAKGDMFTFVQEFEGLDFLGSLKLLADKAGVTLERSDYQGRKEEDRLLDVVEKAAVFFENNLKENKEALSYLSKRGIKDGTIKKWRVGYALDEWRALKSHLSSLGISETEMERAGLIKRSESAKSESYDVFRGRIIFPIFDSSSRPVAFSGRILVETPDAPKYLNSPETELFIKSETLYGLHVAKLGIRKKDYSILVEGQMDLLHCHQAEFDNAVASSGTAFTRSHLEKLQKLSNKIMFVFDSDSAGFAAANKSAVLALSLGMEVKLVELPKGTDPAELIQDDLEAWKAALRGSKHLIDFYLDNLLEKKLDQRKLAKEIEMKVLPFLSMLSSSIEQSHFVSQIAKKTGIREEAIWNDFRRLPKLSSDQVLADDKKNVEKEVQRRRDHIERRLFGLIFWQEGENQRKIEPKALRKRIEDIVGSKEIEEMEKARLKEKEELIFEAEAYYADDGSISLDLDEIFMNFEEDHLREKFVEFMGKLEAAERKKDENTAKNILQECQRITERLAQLSKEKIKK